MLTHVEYNANAKFIGTSRTIMQAQKKNILSLDSVPSLPDKQRWSSDYRQSILEQIH